MTRRITTTGLAMLLVVGSATGTARADPAEEARLRRRVAELSRRVAELEAELARDRAVRRAPLDVRVLPPQAPRSPMIIPFEPEPRPGRDWLRVPSATGDYYIVPTQR